MWFCTQCTKKILPFNHYEEDEDFLVVILENSITSSLIPWDELTSDDKLFIPFELNDDESSPMTDLDPDVQYYNAL